MFSLLFLWLLIFINWYSLLSWVIVIIIKHWRSISILDMQSWLFAKLQFIFFIAFIVLLRLVLSSFILRIIFNIIFCYCIPIIFLIILHVVMHHVLEHRKFLRLFLIYLEHFIVIYCNFCCLREHFLVNIIMIYCF